MISSAVLRRPSCVPITLQCTEYRGVIYSCRSFSDGTVFTIVEENIGYQIASYLHICYKWFKNITTQGASYVAS